MKKLFTVGAQYFDSKAAAKAARGPFKEGGAYVSKGPDHFLFGVRKPGTTHSNSPVKKK